MVRSAAESALESFQNECEFEVCFAMNVFMIELYRTFSNDFSSDLTEL